MRKLLKLIKYIIFAFIFVVLLIYLTGTKPKDIIQSFINISMKYKGLVMQKNDWKEFDFIDIKGEHRAIILGGLDTADPLANYRIRTFYPFDGDVGFVGGSDYEMQWNIQSRAIKNKPSLYDMYWPDKHETAYLFRTEDDGKTFTKIGLLKGYHVDQVIKYKQNYYAIVEDYLWNAKTFVSKDKGKSWNLYYPLSIEAFFSENCFIFSEPTGIQTAQSVSRFKYFYTKNRGKTSIPLSKKIMSYAKNMHPKFQRNFRLVFNVYDGKLLFLDGKDLVSVDMDTEKETRTVLKFPEGYKLASYASREYGKNLLEQYKTRDRNLNALQINKENAKPYILLQKKDTNDKKPAQISIWYPFENKHIIFDKKISQVVPFQVSGDYVGGFIKKDSILVHIWSIDDGKEWNYEVLPDYYLLNGPKVAHDKIWMTALVRGARPDGKKDYPQVKGAFLVMTTIKTDKTKEHEYKK